MKPDAGESTEDERAGGKVNGWVAALETRRTCSLARAGAVCTVMLVVPLACCGEDGNTPVSPSPPAPPAWSDVMMPTSGQFATAGVGHLHVGGVRAGGTVDCWGNGTDCPNLPPSGKYSNVSLGLQLHLRGEDRGHREVMRLRALRS